MNRSTDGTSGAGRVIVRADVGAVADGDPIQELAVRASASRDGRCRAEILTASNYRLTNRTNKRRHPMP